MYKPKQQSLGNLKLPKMQSFPTIKDLTFMISQAGTFKGRIVELPWVSPDRTKSFLLTVCLLEEAIEYMWTFFSENQNELVTLWQHESCDLSLIHNLIYQAAPEYSGSNYITAAELEPAKESMSMQRTSEVHDTTDPVIDIQFLKEKGKAILEGDLQNMQIPTLLQSISMSKMSGCLRIRDVASQAQVYFEDGLPVHAESPETTGDMAVCELITWEEGQFRFYPNEKSEVKSVKRRLDGLLMEGIALLDQRNFLNKAGLKLESLLVKNKEVNSEAEFKQCLTAGAPLDIKTQYKFYNLVDNKSTLLDILRSQPMLKVEWMPVLYNLIACNLVIVGKALVADKLIQVGDVDRTAIQSVVRALNRPETGILTYPALLFFLEQEFYECASIGCPVSLVVFEMKQRVGGDKFEPLSMTQAKEAARRIDRIKRIFDVLAHFETFDYALLLPNTAAKAAKLFAHRILEVVTDEPLTPGGPKGLNNLALHVGIATAPDDTQQISVLLDAAREAKNKAKESGTNILLISEMDKKPE
jgi:hypothetical protein